MKMAMPKYLFGPAPPDRYDSATYSLALPMPIMSSQKPDFQRSPNLSPAFLVSNRRKLPRLQIRWMLFLCIVILTLGGKSFAGWPRAQMRVIGFQESDTANPRAAIISLVRNSELAGIQQSIRQLEFRFNSNTSHQYPWIFFNEEPFTQEFIDGTRNLTSGEAYYEIIPKEHWSIPKWIDEERFMSSLEYLGGIGVGKGWLVSYRRRLDENSFLQLCSVLIMKCRAYVSLELRLLLSAPKTA